MSSQHTKQSSLANHSAYPPPRLCPPHTLTPPALPRPPERQPACCHPYPLAAHDTARAPRAGAATTRSRGERAALAPQVLLGVMRKAAAARNAPATPPGGSRVPGFVGPMSLGPWAIGLGPRVLGSRASAPWGRGSPAWVLGPSLLGSLGPRPWVVGSRFLGCFGFCGP